jgi:hypothetical protein
LRVRAAAASDLFVFVLFFFYKSISVSLPLKQSAAESLLQGQIHMKRLNHLLRQPEFQVFLFCLGLVLLNWPFLAIFQGKRPEALFLYLLLVWTIAVVILFLIARSCRSETILDTDKRQDA